MAMLQAVIFDLDGTLITPEVDFSQLRRKLGFGPGPVWETILSLDGLAHEHAERVLVSAEMAGAQRCKLIPGAKALLDELARRGLKTAILTRNCHAAVDLALRRHELSVAEVLTREDNLMKPDPDGVHELARRLGVRPSETLVVGDYLFDIQAGNRAGATTVLVCTHAVLPDYAHEADYVITDLNDVLSILDGRA
jgi:HAD superfamily hydrolase (TIGR01509 family)